MDFLPNALAYRPLVRRGVARIMEICRGRSLRGVLSARRKKKPKFLYLMRNLDLKWVLTVSESRRRRRG
jgi:hypothetical protein